MRDSLVGPHPRCLCLDCGMNKEGATRKSGPARGPGRAGAGRLPRAPGFLSNGRPTCLHLGRHRGA